MDISKISKKVLVDYINLAFTKKGKKIPKKELNAKTRTELEHIITKNGCEENLIKFSMLKKFIAIGEIDGAEYICEIIALDEADAKKRLKADGIKVTQVALKSNTHKCKYCGNIVFDKYADLLCDECRMMFGHSLYSEL